jgi:hypothetical protein
MIGESLYVSHSVSGALQDQTILMGNQHGVPDNIQMR